MVNGLHLYSAFIQSAVHLYSAFIQSAVHLYSAFIQSAVHLYSAFIQSAVHLYSAFIQSALQFRPLAHTHIHTPRDWLPCEPVPSRLARSNRLLGVSLRDTDIAPRGIEPNPPTASRLALHPDAVIFT